MTARLGRVGSAVVTLGALATLAAGCGGSDGPTTTTEASTAATASTPIDTTGATSGATTTPERTASKSSLDAKGSFVQYIVGVKSGGWELQRLGTKVEDGTTAAAILVVSDTDVDPNTVDFSVAMTMQDGTTATVRQQYVETFRNIPRAWIVAMATAPGVATEFASFTATPR